MLPGITTRVRHRACSPRRQRRKKIEDENGTLPRLFTTPTSQAAILGGKLLSVVLALLVQIVVLLLVSSLIFDINWGEPASLLLATTGLVAAGAGFGVILNPMLQEEDPRPKARWRARRR